MEKNIFIKWLLEGREFGRMMVERIEDIENILSITLKNEGDASGDLVTLTFDPYVAFQNMNESYRARTFAEKGGFKTDSLFTIDNSSWLEWLHKESLGYYSDDDLIHYSIITGADCLDIISEFPPEIKVISPQSEA